ncbi:MAG: uracil-DNA glycosylase [Acidiferrobacterales bacterium]
MAGREDLRRQYLAAMGVRVWAPRHQGAAPSREDAAGIPPPMSAPSADIIPLHRKSRQESEGPGSDRRSSPVSEMDWGALEQAVHGCSQCHLHAGRTRTVFGTGNRHARWMFVGEAPGAEEDRQGEPFVGRAGQLLNAILQAVKLEREDVYIANVLKCRPPENRDPQPDEIVQCEPYLLRQIELIQPRLIIALGRHAAHSLLKTDLALNKLRGQPKSYHGIPLIVTYHPAYLLRNPVDKRKVWEDLQLARALVEKST